MAARWNSPVFKDSNDMTAPMTARSAAETRNKVFRYSMIAGQDHAKIHRDRHVTGGTRLRGRDRNCRRIAGWFHDRRAGGAGGLDWTPLGPGVILPEVQPVQLDE
jgi:hypothetical protein